MFEPGQSELDLYLIALGSNQRHHRIGSPRKVIASALRALGSAGGEAIAVSPLITSRPVGPSQRDYINGAALVSSTHTPHAMLAALQEIERLHGRDRRGQHWRARTLDLDIVLWSGGVVEDFDLTIPHPRFRERDFVLGPAAAIAPRWRDPKTTLTLRQLYARLTRRRPLPR